jgi:ribonuclease BN (tRNA processing enzyme)
MPRVIVLGSGGPQPNPVRWGTSFLVEIGGEWMMFDCGFATTYNLYKAGFKATQVDHLFFTHHHSDHDADYPSFLLVRWDMSIGKENDLRVYGPTLTTQLTERLLGEGVGAFWHDIVARTQHPLSQWAHEERGGTLPRKPPKILAKDVGPGTVATGDRWEITATRVEHVQPYLDSLAYRIDSDEGSIVFSGDTRPCNALTELATGADLLVMGCVGIQSEMDGTAAAESATGTLGTGRTATQAGAKKLLLFHQSTLDVPGRREQALIEVSSVYSGPIIWGNELMEVPWG